MVSLRAMLIAFSLVAVQPAEPAGAPQPDCTYDLEAMLTLDRDAFDQDMDGGWRVLSRKDGCELAAAELIREWRQTKRDHTGILYWHEGQMRALAGQTDAAISLFRLTYNPPETDADFGWNYYVSGTIAFLMRDRENLSAAIEELKTIPEPADNSFTRPDRTTAQLRWPPNLNVLEGFEKCWDESYADAYGNRDCSAPATK